MKTEKKTAVADGGTSPRAELSVEINNEEHHVALTVGGRLLQRERCDVDAMGLVVHDEWAVEALLSSVGRLLLQNLDGIVGSGAACIARVRLHGARPSPSLTAEVQATVDRLLSLAAGAASLPVGAGLPAMVSRGRGPEEVRADLAEWKCAQGIVERASMEMLPSEEAHWRRMEHEAKDRIAALAAEGRFQGTLDLAALLLQMRPGPAPRWFLYPAMSPCDAVEWRQDEEIRFRFLRGTQEVGVLPFRLPNPFQRQGTWRARTILLPATVRGRARKLHREGLETFVLYEPAKVVHEEFKPPKLERPDPALLVRIGRKWFVDRIWEDPAVEDPRALNTLREFYVGPALPPPW